MSEFKPFNIETHPEYNREPGIVIVPGSNYAKEMEKFEQFPSKYGTNPGNPYVYRPFPKMLYRAQLYQGVMACMAAPPDSGEFKGSPDEYQRACEAAQRFTDKCQRIVHSEAEMARAMEDGWRRTPAEAVAYLEGREKDRATATAERNYADRNMSEPAKREAAAAVAAVGGEHLPELPEQPKRRRGRPRKNPIPPAA
ncbi:MAG: hypothetical protein VW405_20360 [Rhodospirillaceae bacterium]